MICFLSTEINVEPCNGEMQAAGTLDGVPSRKSQLHKQAGQFVIFDGTQLPLPNM